MDQIVSPYVLYAACALGAVGLLLALPNRRRSAQLIGGVVAMAAGGVALVGLALRNPEAIPNIFFYVFALISLGAALRVVTHPRPVYAALYFILTILSTAGLFVLLSAEFMAFALIIVYAGAILITYLFVIMLATQAPTEDQLETLTEYDTASREPVAAIGSGFVLLAALTTLLFTGVPRLPAGEPPQSDLIAARMPRKLERELRTHGVLPAGAAVVRNARGEATLGEAPGEVVIENEEGVRSTVHVPDSLKARNIERIGFQLIGDHPGAIEIAGVILLMAMLGALVLSRKQVDLDEDAKSRQLGRLSDAGAEGGG